MLPQFQPPSIEEKRKALGALTGSPFLLRKSIEKSYDQFEDIPIPGPSDWLATNYEHGQTFDEFKVYANIPNPHKNKFYIQPYDSKLSENLIRVLKNHSTIFFPGVKFIIRETVDVNSIGVESREELGLIQFDACQIINKMHQIAPLDRFAMIGVTSEDIYSRDLNFVFGLANVYSKSGIFSFARYTQEFYSLPPDNDLVIIRAVKVMLHEMCHMFGLLHCIYFKCLMNGSNHIGETDAQPIYLCPVCLRKLHLCLNFNPIDRYKALAVSCKELGGYFSSYSCWYLNRVANIENSLPGKKQKAKK